MKENFEKAKNFVLLREGYRSDDPDDSGGLTIWGISAKSHPGEVEEMKGMSRSESRERAVQIYKRLYWDSLDCDHAPAGVDIFLFDTAVNLGVKRVKSFQVRFGNDLFSLFIARIEFYVSIAKNGNNIKFLRGWLNRVIQLFYFIREE